MTVELLACPFCGGEAQVASYNSCDCCGKAWNGQVICQKCGASHDHFDTDEEAIAAWNARSALEGVAGLVEALEGLIPTNINLDHVKLSDDQTLPCDVTVGELRNAKAALATFRDQGGRS